MLIDMFLISGTLFFSLAVLDYIAEYIKYRKYK